MKTQTACQLSGRHPARRAAGSILIIVLWITFGLISMALYFGHSMVYEFRAADQSAAGVQADQAIEGAARYITFVLTNYAVLGQFPDTNYVNYAAVPVGEASFWVLGRGEPDPTRTVPFYGLVDEASKLNLNTATIDMLEMLPRITPELAAAIIDWRDTDSDVTPGGAESDTYLQRNPPYTCKNAPFESLEELRLVAGADWDILYGEDSNLNGILDANEDDANATLPDDNRDGKLDPGILEYLTVYSREPNKSSDGTARINLNDTNAVSGNLSTRLQTVFGQRSTQIAAQLQSGAGTYKSLVDVYFQSGLTPQEFGQIADFLTVTNATYVEGMINVNTASEVVLSCIPGIGLDNAPQMVAYRRTKTTNDLYSVAWVTEVLARTNAVAAGPYITTFSYQFSADVVALGNQGRGYRRTWFVFDTSEDTPKIIYRRDRGRLGWALGKETQKSSLVFGKELR